MRARLIILTLTLLTSGLAGQVLAGTTGSIPVVYVNASATGANDGSSWADAYNDLQDALDPNNTASPAEVWVAAGVYKPVEPEDFGNPTTEERDESFNLRNGLTIYGGFAGVETQLDQRDWEENLTVLSGDIANSSNIDANGIVNHPSDLGGGNSYSVVVGSDTVANAILDGFIITGGWADRTQFNCQSNTDIRHHGAAIYSQAGHPTIRKTSFIGNQARCRGGALYSISGSSPTLKDVRMISNSSGNSGGAIYTSGGDLILINTVLRGNASSTGGAIHNRGAITLSNSEISGNLAARGGGIHHSGDPSTLTNVVIAGNRATSTTNSSSGGISHGTDIQLFNTVIWGNKVGSVVGSANSSYTGSPIVRYSLIQGRDPNGDGNFDCVEPCPEPRFLESLDPDFAPSAEGDFRLGAGSPAIDAGNNNFVEVDFDLDGNPRIQNDIVDLGPYESEGPIFRDRFE